MKTDLATSIVAAIVGVVAAYFVCGLFLPSIDDVTIKTLNSNTSYEVTQPNSEIFNFRAINPTVEVYVGQCAEYDENGECVEITEDTANYEDNIIEETEEIKEAESEETSDTPISEDQEVNEETQNGTSN